MNFLIFLSLFLVWSGPFVVGPAVRTLSRGSAFPTYSAYLLFSAAALLTYLCWSDGDFVLLFLAPLLPPFTAIYYKTIMAYGFTSIFWYAVLAIATAFAMTLWFKGRARLVLAIIFPIVIVTVSLLVIAQKSDREIQEGFVAIGGTCLDAQSFLVSLKERWPNSHFHAVARSGDQLFNWSYKSHSWQVIAPNDRHKFFAAAPTGKCALER